MSIAFLSKARVLWIQKDQVDRYGGQHGIRSEPLLESAIAQPQAMFGGEFLHADIYEMAAAYMFHLVQNHAFFDGNKRVGAVAADIFLRMNDIRTVVPHEEYEALVLRVASGEVQKPEIAAFLKKYSTRVEK